MEGRESDTGTERADRRRRRMDAALTSSGVERVTVGELRLRGRRTWGSLRWLPPLAPPGDGVTPPPAAPPAEPLAPSSACCQGEKEPLQSACPPQAATAPLREPLMRGRVGADNGEELLPAAQARHRRH